MRKIILEPVDNGLIRTIIDDNADGAGRKLEDKKIFILEDDVNKSHSFILKLIDDLGLFIGNDYDKNILSIEKDYGPKYQLAYEEVVAERKRLTHRLNELKKISTIKKEVNEEEKVNN